MQYVIAICICNQQYANLSFSHSPSVFTIRSLCSLETIYKYIFLSLPFFQVIHYFSRPLFISPFQRFFIFTSILKSTSSPIPTLFTQPHPLGRPFFATLTLLTVIWLFLLSFHSFLCPHNNCSKMPEGWTQGNSKI